MALAVESQSLVVDQAFTALSEAIAILQSNVEALAFAQQALEICENGPPEVLMAKPDRKPHVLADSMMLLRTMQAEVMEWCRAFVRKMKRK